MKTRESAGIQILPDRNGSMFGVQLDSIICSLSGVINRLTFTSPLNNLSLLSHELQVERNLDGSEKEGSTRQANDQD
jgi:hypothetical protein